MLIDTHCHLDASEFDADREAVIESAKAAGVDVIVVPAVEAGNFAAVRALAQRVGAVRVAYGIHPLFVDRAQPVDLDVLREHLSRGEAVAVGEIGLDDFVQGGDGERQMFFFREQLKLAREFDLPVILHIRRAQDKVLQALRAIKVQGGIAHAFNGSEVQAQAFVKLGLRLGFGGAMTYPRALRIRGLAASLPQHSIVLETDSPDIPPEWARGQRNEPAHLPRIAQVLADLRGMSIETLIKMTYENACAALPALQHLKPKEAR